ncbi:dTMP kinase [Candidatus Berkelbacteria bacterium RIFOXYA2_FULL_43_10]|uniref:Thymidylate kinase n=1 Tax=Candidatus Berkelbacteria bacterium RIFOXYA2_FULL_43_10 TaxID=1797472 RepID=A0A1F5E5E9_9BACT|nr:MAG: dTMP kinase [Candidatus Berkelbacteria bacterium RIFOXYA2_FULL_43_10]
MHKGKLIVFEGLDGAGSSTQAGLLYERLNRAGHKSIISKEPTNNIIGGLIRGVLTKDWKIGEAGLQLLYAADRHHHAETKVMPALLEGINVILDRYFFSSYAYGGINIDIKWLENLNKGLPEPDLAFYIDVPPKECIHRIAASRYSLEYFEDLKKLSIARKNYRRLAKKYPNIVEIKGMAEPDKIADLVYKQAKDIVK